MKLIMLKRLIQLNKICNNMFRIDYYINHDNIENNQPITDGDIRYHLFAGGLFFRNESTTVSMDWDWVPVLDVAICFTVIDNNFRNNINANEFDFTESNEKIFFNKINDQIQIATSFTSEIFSLTTSEFHNAVVSFSGDVCQDIQSRSHEIAQNPIFLKYLAMIKLNNAKK